MGIDWIKTGDIEIEYVGDTTLILLFCSLWYQRITSHVAIVDAFPKKLEGEGMDLTHGSVFLGDPKIEYDTGTKIYLVRQISKLCD